MDGDILIGMIIGALLSAVVLAIGMEVHSTSAFNVCTDLMHVTKCEWRMIPIERSEEEL